MNTGTKILTYASHQAISERYSRSPPIDSCSLLSKLQASLPLVGLFLKQRKPLLILLNTDRAACANLKKQALIPCKVSQLWNAVPTEYCRELNYCQGCCTFMTGNLILQTPYRPLLCTSLLELTRCMTKQYSVTIFSRPLYNVSISFQFNKFSFLGCSNFSPLKLKPIHLLSFTFISFGEE